MIDFSIPLAGLDRATSSLNMTASNIAKSSFPEGDSVDLSREMVDLIQSRRDFQINASVVRADNEVSKSVLNLLA